MVPLSARTQSRPAPVTLAVFLAVLATATAAGAQSRAPVEWSQYQGGSGRPGEAMSGRGPAPPYRVRWAVSAPDGTSLSGAVIAEGTAITIGREAVYGVDLDTGEVVWEVTRRGGPLSVPAIGEAAGARILVYLEGPEERVEAPSPTPTPSPSPAGGGDQEQSALVALDLADRSERWRVALGAVARGGVTIDSDTAYVGDQAGVVHAIALDDGSERWTSQVGGLADIPIAVGAGRVYVISRDVDEGRVLITALGVEDGERSWRVSPQVGSTAAAAPALVAGGVVIGTADRFVRMLGAEDGEERWSSLALSLFSPVSSPAAGADDVLIADLGGGLYRLAVDDGARRWGFQFNELILRSSPVRSGGVAVVGLNDGRLAAVDLETGRLVWQGGPTPGLVGTIAVSADVLVAVKGGLEAGLIAFEHDPGGERVDEPSPTELALGTTLARAGLAALAVLAVVFVPAMLARRRFGDAFGEPGELDEEGS